MATNATKMCLQLSSFLAILLDLWLLNTKLAKLRGGQCHTTAFTYSFFASWLSWWISGSWLLTTKPGDDSVATSATQLLGQLPCFLAILQDLWLAASEYTIGESSVGSNATKLLIQLPCCLAIFWICGS